MMKIPKIINNNINIFILILLVILCIIGLILNKENFYIWEEKISGVVYINLENRPDRKSLIESEIKKMNISDNKVNKVAGIYVPKNGHKGCIQSHLLALRIAKMNKWNNILILEDDAVISVSEKEFENKLNYIFNYLDGKNWDVIMLSIANQSYEDTDDDDIKRIKGGTLGTAYIVNRHYYDDLITLFEDCNYKMPYSKWGTDDGHEPNALDQRWSELQKKDKWYCYKKPLIIQRNIWSTTNNRGKK